MRIDYLIYFLNVAQSKSINISARQLYLSQQSLSRAMKTLEEEVGAPLLKRHYYGVALTEVGEIVAEYAGRIVKEHYAMQKAILPYLDPVSEASSGQLRVGINYHIVNEMLHTIVHTFTRQNPGVRLEICDCSAAQMPSAVLSGQIDLALFGDWGGGAEHTGDTDEAAAAKKSDHGQPLISENLHEAEILVCVSRKSPLAAKRVLQPQELLAEPLIQYTDQSIIKNFFSGYGTPRILLETSSTELYRQMIQDNAGYGLTNRLDWQEDYSFAEKNHLAVIPVDHPHAAVLYRLLYRKQDLDNSCLAAFLNIVRKRFDLLNRHS